MGPTVTPTETRTGTPDAPPTVSSEASRPSDTWWRRNRAWLLALCIVMPITVATVFSKSAREWRHRHPATLDVAYDDTVELTGASIGPATAAVSDAVDGPPRTRVVEVSIMIGGDRSLACKAPILREFGGKQRRWVADVGASPAPSDSDEVASPIACDAEQSRPYRIETAYWVPDDAVGPFVIELATLSPSRVVLLRVRP